MIHTRHRIGRRHAAPRRTTRIPPTLPSPEPPPRPAVRINCPTGQEYGSASTRGRFRAPRQLGQCLVAEQKDRGQAQPATDDDGGHQDHAVEFVRRARRPRIARTTPARPRSSGMCARVFAPPWYHACGPMNLRDANPTTNVRAALPRSSHPTVVSEIDTSHPVSPTPRVSL